MRQPHVVILSDLVQAAPGEEPSVWHRNFFGPFIDRTSAITWAEARAVANDAFGWETARIDSVQRFDAALVAVARDGVAELLQLLLDRPPRHQLVNLPSLLLDNEWAISS